MREYENACVRACVYTLVRAGGVSSTLSFATTARAKHALSACASAQCAFCLLWATGAFEAVEASRCDQGVSAGPRGGGAPGQPTVLLVDMNLALAAHRLRAERQQRHAALQP
eukprot:6201655-Pleurochrysis_carterae.AAC.3